MNDKQNHLPSFKNPPVNEVILSAQFKDLAIENARWGLFWREIQDQFPHLEEHPEINTVIEHRNLLQGGINIQVDTGLPTLRYWFIDETKKELMQVQHNRFIKNWRKTKIDDQYPRYKSLKPKFDQHFKLFCDFISAQNLGFIEINQCEVTYINQIFAGEGWNHHSELDEVFNIKFNLDNKINQKIENPSFQLKFPILDSKKNFIGRLHIQMQSVFREKQPVFILTLTARGQIGKNLDFLDVGRETVVCTFKDITTPKMHEIWGIQ